MNRAYEGRQIFLKPSLSMAFLSILFSAIRKYRIRLAAWCIMPNHYHLLLQNTSGRLSEFMKYLDSNTAKTFRQQQGGKGFVFQNRFKSTLIDEEHYWEAAFFYLLMNPVKAGLAQSPWDYPLSSINEYHRKKKGICDQSAVLDRFPDKSSLKNALSRWIPSPPLIVKTRPGLIWGNYAFAAKVLKQFEKRKNPGETKRRRIKEDDFETIDSVIREFEQSEDTLLPNASFSTYREKRLRALLLAALKDRCGLTYSKIATLPWFRRLKMSSLGKIYQNEVKKKGTG